MDTAADRGPDAYAEGEAREAPFLEPFERAYGTVKRILSSYATLGVLDLRRAAVQFAWLVAGGIVISVLVVTAWLAAVIALAVWLLGNGLSWPAVLLIAGAVNIVGAGIVAFRLRGIFERMPFEATLHQLKSDSPAAHAGAKVTGSDGK